MRGKFSLNYIDENILYQKYIVERKSTRIVGEEMRFPKTNILNALVYYNIPKRHPTGVKIIPKEFLELEYIEKHKSIKIIAQEYPCSTATVHKFLHLYGIKTKIRGKSYLSWFLKPENKEKVKLVREKTGESRKEFWKNADKNSIEYKKLIESSVKGAKNCAKVLSKTTRKYPNKKEILLNKILKELFGNEYKFVGNGKVWIEKYNPDFININGQKKIIEHFGEYWHNLPKYKIRDEKKLNIYKKYGYQTLVIWEHELNNLDKLKNKLLRFHN